MSPCFPGSCSYHYFLGWKNGNLLARNDADESVGSRSQTDPRWAPLYNEPLLVLLWVVPKAQEPPAALGIQDMPLHVCEEGQAAGFQVQVKGRLRGGHRGQLLCSGDKLVGGGLQVAGPLPEPQEEAALLQVGHRGIHPDPVQLWVSSGVELAAGVEEDHVHVFGQLGHPQVVSGQASGHAEDILTIRLQELLALQLLKGPGPTWMDLQQKPALLLGRWPSTTHRAICFHQEKLPLMPNQCHHVLLPLFCGHTQLPGLGEQKWPVTSPADQLGKAQLP